MGLFKIYVEIIPFFGHIVWTVNLVLFYKNQSRKFVDFVSVSHSISMEGTMRRIEYLNNCNKFHCSATQHRVWVSERSYLLCIIVNGGNDILTQELTVIVTVTNYLSSRQHLHPRTQIRCKLAQSWGSGMWSAKRWNSLINQPLTSWPPVWRRHFWHSNTVLRHGPSTKIMAPGEN